MPQRLVRAGIVTAAGGEERTPRAARALPSVVLLGALAIRVDFTFNAYCFKDGHGTAALVLWHILQGRELPFYDYGSFKVGTIGDYLGAAMLALFGVSPESLCFAMTLFSLWLKPRTQSPRRDRAVAVGVVDLVGSSRESDGSAGATSM